MTVADVHGVHGALPGPVSLYLSEVILPQLWALVFGLTLYHSGYLSWDDLPHMIPAKMATLCQGEMTGLNIPVPWSEQGGFLASNSVPAHKTHQDLGGSLSTDEAPKNRWRFGGMAIRKSRNKDV